MPHAAPLQSNFNAGELSPLMYGRTDVAKYKNGLASCINYLPLVQGGLVRRPGTYYAASTKLGSTRTSRLVPFEFSTTQAYVLEFGHGYIRFYTNNGQLTSGGSPYEVSTSYTESDLPSLRFSQSADVLYITHPSYPPAKLSRLAATNWTLASISFKDGPYLPTNTTSTTLSLSATSGGGIVVTASAATFVATDVGRMLRLGYYPPQWVSGGSYALGATVRNDSGKVYLCTKGGVTGAGSGPTGYGGGIVDGSCTWAYSADSGERWGWGTITGYSSSTSVTITAGATFADVTASADWRISVWGSANGYPAVSTFYEDRLVFAGCPQYPQRVDFSCVSNYETFSPTNSSGVTTAAEAIAITMNSSDVNGVRWIAGDEKGLLVGTAGGEWIIRPSSNAEALSPLNVAAKQSTFHGSANVRPVRAGKATLFVQRAGRKLRELAYVIDVDGFKAPDMTVLSEHVTAGGVTEMAFQKELKSIVWCVRSDGVLLGLTYDRDQDVIGWHRHTLGGSFGSGNPVVESIACIPSADGTRDELWLQVKRTVNGATVRTIEYMKKVWESGDAQADAFYVDCGATYSGTPATTISGLSWLEGQTVQILADGAVHPAQVVTGGAIKLSASASKVHVGLGYQSDAKTLPWDAGSADGTPQGKTRRLNHMALRLLDTLGMKKGKDFDHLTPIVFRKTNSKMTQAVPLFSGIKEFDWDDDYGLDGVVCLRQDQPTPGTILAIMPQGVTYDRG